jgi:DNA-binding NtrC family response regulator
MSPKAPVDPEHSHLAEILDFRPEQGVIRLHEQRVVILSTVALGLLRKELNDTLGRDATRRIMLRFGYADGYHDAVSLRDRSTWASPLDGLRAGVVLHRLEGIVQAEITRVEVDEQSGKFDAEVIWRNSYVAEQHVHHSGKSDDPICWSLVGYASGYASACFGREIYYDEVSCVAQGRAHCSIVGKDAASWGDELLRLRTDFQSGDLGAEVERLRALVHERIKDLDRREHVVAKRERELNLLRERVAHLAAKKHFIAGSASMQQVLEFAARVAPLDTTVLVQGESGTGKEFIVRLIHDQSPRASGPFVSINCAALTETLLESELFGHVRGAFTGAVREKPGLFEVASGGTLFLDEIGEVAPTVQAKLLRALQEREIRRVGAERNITVNARVVAATNRNLREAVAAGTFREDLFFRLGAFVIEVPPLRDRREDIPALVQDFIRRASTRMKKDADAISATAMNALMNYHWPGNVRELQHAIERAVILAQSATIQVRELPPEVTRKTTRSTGDDTLNLAEQELVMIERALKRFNGNRREAANALKISPVTLWRKMKRYGLEG